MKRLHVFYSGRVQGVGFRYIVQETARPLGISGWVRNRREGRVELVAEGDEKALLEFLGVMKSGPLGSNISNAEIAWEEATGELRGFSTRPTV